MARRAGYELTDPRDFVMDVVMDFSLSAEAREIAAKAREFVDSEVVGAERLLDGDADALERELARLREEARRRGLWAPHMPKSIGGMGLSLLDFAPVAEALGRSPLAHYACNCAAPDAGRASAAPSTNAAAALRYPAESVDPSTPASRAFRPAPGSPTAGTRASAPAAGSPGCAASLHARLPPRQSRAPR